MTIAEDIWLRSQAAQTNLLHIASYNTAFFGTATLQAWQMTLSAPATFWSAMSRASGAAANAPLERAVGGGVVPISVAAPAKPAKSKPAVAAPKSAEVTELRPAPAAKPAAKPDAAAEPKAAKAEAKPEAAPAAKPKPAAKKPVAKKVPVPEPNPLLLDEPRGGKPDDLKELSGIGAKLETTLNEFGIYHFDQIAGLNEDGIAWLNAQQKGFAMTAERFDLVAQAKAKHAG